MEDVRLQPQLPGSQQPVRVDNPGGAAGKIGMERRGPVIR